MEYAVLGGLLRRAFGLRGPRGWALALVVGAAVGAMDECYQKIVPGRFSSVFDWFADVSGAAIGSALAPIVQKWLAGATSRLKRMGE